MPPQSPAVVLVVDDDATVRQLAEMILQNEGFAVPAASDANDALRLYHASNRHVDVLISDINMPGPNGFELAEMLVGSGAIRHVLLISGHPENAEPAQKRGMAFLHKPFTCNSLIAAVRRLLESGESERIA